MFFNQLGLYFIKKTKNCIMVIDKLSQEATQHKLEPKKEIICHICTRVRGRLDETCLQPYPERWSDFSRNKRFLPVLRCHSKSHRRKIWNVMEVKIPLKRVQQSPQTNHELAGRCDKTMGFLVASVTVYFSSWLQTLLSFCSLIQLQRRNP